MQMISSVPSRPFASLPSLSSLRTVMLSHVRRLRGNLRSLDVAKRMECVQLAGAFGWAQFEKRKQAPRTPYASRHRERTKFFAAYEHARPLGTKEATELRNPSAFLRPIFSGYSCAPAPPPLCVLGVLGVRHSDWFTHRNSLRQQGRTVRRFYPFLESGAGPSSFALVCAPPPNAASTPPNIPWR